MAYPIRARCSGRFVVAIVRPKKCFVCELELRQRRMMVDEKERAGQRSVTRSKMGKSGGGRKRHGNGAVRVAFWWRGVEESVDKGVVPGHRLWPGQSGIRTR